LALDQSEPGSAVSLNHRDSPGNLNSKSNYHQNSQFRGLNCLCHFLEMAPESPFPKALAAYTTLPQDSGHGHTYHPKDAIGESSKAGLKTGIVGAMFSGIQATLTRQNIGALGAVTKYGGTMAMFGIHWCFGIVDLITLIDFTSCYRCNIYLRTRCLVKSKRRR
jgi:hypothetical protein